MRPEKQFARDMLRRANYWGFEDSGDDDESEHEDGGNVIGNADEDGAGNVVRW